MAHQTAQANHEAPLSEKALRLIAAHDREVRRHSTD